MDPISALIGGGMSLLGGMMNTSSAQSINAANIAEQQWSAQGGYLPGLVRNANAAGLSPLAVLGSRGPNMAVQVGTQPGAGLEAAGRSIAQVNPYKAQEEELAAKLGQSNIDRAKAEASNAKITAATNAAMLDRFISHPSWLPSIASEPTPTGVATELVHGAVDRAPAIASDAWRSYGLPAWNAVNRGVDIIKNYSDQVSGVFQQPGF